MAGGYIVGDVVDVHVIVDGEIKLLSNALITQTGSRPRLRVYSNGHIYSTNEANVVRLLCNRQSYKNAEN